MAILASNGHSQVWTFDFLTTMPVATFSPLNIFLSVFPIYWETSWKKKVKLIDIDISKYITNKNIFF